MTTTPQEESLNRRDVLRFTGGVAATTLISSNPTKTLAAESRRRITAWMSHYDWDEAVRSATRYADRIEAISPGWYELKNEGEIVPNSKARIDDRRLVGLVAKNGMPVRPLVMNIVAARTQPELVKIMFTDKAMRLTHHQQLRKLAECHDGMVLDYEGLRLPDMPRFVEMVEEIALILKSIGKTFGVTLEALVDENIIPYWKRIAYAADTVYVMAYGQKPKTPGPFVDLSWLQSVIEQSVRGVPPEKLVLGLAVYGLKWDATGVSSGTWQQYTERAHNLRAPLKIDGKTGMLWYQSNSESMWVECATSIDMKIRMASQSGIRRFAFWRLGGEDPEIWQAVRSLP